MAVFDVHSFLIGSIALKTTGSFFSLFTLGCVFTDGSVEIEFVIEKKKIFVRSRLKTNTLVGKKVL